LLTPRGCATPPDAVQVIGKRTRYAGSALNPCNPEIRG
jgi:hypothetical protein